MSPRTCLACWEGIWQEQVGWHLGVAPHQDSILAALRMAFRRWCIPTHCRIDNGRDFASKLLTGITKATRDRLRKELGADWKRALRSAEHLVECVDPRFKGVFHELDVELIYAMPYRARSKGTLERWFRTFEDNVSRTFATYCGNSTVTRPECLQDIRRGYTRAQRRALKRRYGRGWLKAAFLKFVDQSAVPTLDQVREAVGQWIDIYHRSAHRGDGMNGAAPLAVWKTAATLRRADEQALLFLMEARGVYTVGANGVAFKVGDRVLRYGATAPCLATLRGRDVFITLDPADLSHCHAWTPDQAGRRYLGRLDSDDGISPLATIDEVRKASASLERRRKVRHRAEREAPAAMRTMAQELAASRRSRHAQLGATGTDDHRPHVVNLEPVRTGFEGLSRPARTERPTRDTAALWKALGSGRERSGAESEGRQLTLADLTCGNAYQASPTEGSDADGGKDAEQPADLLGLIGGGIGMNEPTPTNDRAFEALAQDARVVRTARMLNEDAKLQANQRTDIAERFQRFMEQYGYTQAAVARELGWSTSTMSDVVRLTYKGDSIDRKLIALHNWMELAARRENMLRKRRFVEHSVASEILQVAGLVAETCKMGVVFGPAQIGKTMTLEAIQGDQRFGDPVLIRIDESMLRPFPLCREIASRFELTTGGTFDAVFRRLVGRLAGTKRMLIFDEVERVSHKALEFIRDLHDRTGCPVLLCGKPAVFEKLGFRHVGDYSEVTDQLAARIIIRRDLTLRTRGKNPKPLYSLDDIRNLIRGADLKLHVSPDAVKWLQMRACTLGTGGIGIALGCLYLAYKLAFVQGLEAITAEQLESVADLTIGHEDAERVAEVVAESSGMRRVV